MVWYHTNQMILSYCYLTISSDRVSEQQKILNKTVSYHLAEKVWSFFDVVVTGDK